MLGLPRRWRAGVVGFTAVLTLGALAAPGVQAGPAGGPDVAGQWTQPFEENGAATPRCRPGSDGELVCKPSAVEAAVLGDGRVLYLHGIESGENAQGPAAPALAPPSRHGQARLLDLRTGTPQWSTPTPGRGAGPDRDRSQGDLSCSDITTLPNGKVLLAGGAELDGLRTTWLFDPQTASFEPGAPMKYGRWYPHVVIGADGAPTVFGGVTTFVADTRPGNVRRTETYHADTDTWTENYADDGSENSLPLLPRVVLAPNGQFFYAATGQMWSPFGQSVDEALWSFFQFFDPKKKTWSVSGPAPLGARSGAFVVPLTMVPPYESMTLMTWGGVLGPAPGPGLPANPLTTLTTIDADGTVTNRDTGRLHHARWFSSGVLLPDGQVLAVGGDDKDDVVDPGMGAPVLTPELYNPATGEWTDMAPHTRDRGYHNTALLLPDMRVLLGGKDKDPSFEVWSPPYLFRGPRPTVTHVQKGIGYGDTFTVTTPDAALVESVVLLRTPSPEHVNDSDQRALQLEFTRSGPTTVTATAPPSGNVAPPGTYYLVVNRKSLQGPIPSVARMVDVGRADLSEALQPFPDDAPAPAGGTATADEDTSITHSFGMIDRRRWLLPPA